MKKCLALAMVAIMLLCLIPTISVFAAKEESISQLTLTVTAPKEGEKPSYNKIDGRGYYSDNGLQGSSTRIFKNGIAWYKSASSYFSPGTTATFEGNKSYTVKINLLPKGNFAFASNITATINGKTASVDIYDDGSILVEATLTSSADNKTAIRNVNLTVVKPVIGKTPTFAKVNTTQYLSEKYGTISNCTNGVTWTNQSSGINLTISNPFKEGVKYKVTYYLTAKDGYKFDSNTKATINSTTAVVTVKDSTHATVSLSNLLPGDGKKEISNLDLSVTAPKEGEKPNYTKIDGTGYYSDNGINGTSTKIYKNGIAFYKSASSYISPGTTETFKGGTEYTVKIALTAKDGYKFAKSLTAKINGKSATIETFDDGSINASVKLTALSKDHKHKNSDWKTDKDNHWKVCTDSACGSITVAKEAHKDANKDDKCDVCAYNIAKNTPAPESESSQQNTTSSAKNPDNTTSQPTQENDGAVDKIEDTTTESDTITTGPKDENTEENNNILIFVIIGAAVVLIAGIITAIVIFKKKKQTK